MNGVEFAKRIRGQSINLTQKITDRAKARGARGTIFLSIGVPNEPLEPRFLAQSVRALRQNRTAYTTTAGIPELREAVARRRPRFRTADNVLITAGASEAIFLVLASLINPGDEVVVISPSYFKYPRGTTFFSGKPVFVPLTIRDTSLDLDCELIEGAITARTKLIVVNSPHNPTGWVASPAQLKRLVGIVEKHRLVLLSDEIYKDYSYEREFLSPEVYSTRVIVVDGISKTFSATGLRIGWIIADREIIDRILPVHQLTVFAAPTPFQWAAYQLYRRGFHAYTDSVRRRYRRRRDLVVERLGANGMLEVPKPGGAFYVFPRFPNRDSAKFSDALLQRERVVVVPGGDFGAQWTDYFRIAYGQPERTLVEACRRINRLVQEWGPSSQG